MRHGHGAFDVLGGGIRGLPQQSNDPVPCVVHHVSFMLRILLGRVRKQFRGRTLIHVKPPRKPKGGSPPVWKSSPCVGAKKTPHDMPALTISAIDPVKPCASMT